MDIDYTQIYNYVIVHPGYMIIIGLIQLAVWYGLMSSIIDGNADVVKSKYMLFFLALPFGWILMIFISIFFLIYAILFGIVSLIKKYIHYWNNAKLY